MSSAWFGGMMAGHTNAPYTCSEFLREAGWTEDEAKESLALARSLDPTFAARLDLTEDDKTFLRSCNVRAE